MIPTIQILPGFYKRFLSGFPWLYANEILQSQSTKDIEPGELVVVADQGSPIAVGYYNKHSLISFRALSRHYHHITQQQPINLEFFKQRLQQAVALRQKFYAKPYYRMVYAEADLLPGLIVDRFNDIFVLQVNTQGMEKLKPLLIQALQELFNPTTIFIKNDSGIRKLEQLLVGEPEIIGKPLTHLTVLENDTQFRVDMTSSQKTGWFYDHQANRQQIAALSKDKTVLDYFCYSGGFSIQAAKQQAKKVIGIDSSDIALQNARFSAELNGVSNICEFLVKDVFEDMDSRLSKNQTFDIVILDPPAFVKSKKDFNAGLKGYEKLIAKAIPLVAKQGLLLIASCSYHVKEADLKHCLIKALVKTKRLGQIVKTLSAGPDHPMHPMLDESSYLKGFWVTISE